MSARHSLGHIFLVAIYLTAAGCGGEEQERAAPTSAEAASTSPAAAEERALEDEENTANPAPGGDEGTRAGPRPPIPSEAMVQQMLGQRVIDDPAVQPFLHLEVAANVPLEVWAGARLDEGAPQLGAAGQPVRVVATPGEARLRLTERRELAGSGVRVLFEIPDEGVRGHVHLELRDNVWQRVSSEAVEQ